MSGVGNPTPICANGCPMDKATIKRLEAKVVRVEALASEWARNAGPGSRAADVFGPQKVSVDFAVREIRAALADRPTDG